MMDTSCRFLVYTFQSACWLATAFLLCYWIYLFYLDDDICLVDYKKYYYTPDHGFPKLSFCLKDPYIKSQLRPDNSEISAETYSKFLGGKHFSPSMLKINHSNVLLDASKYVDRYYMEWRNGTSKERGLIPSDDNEMLIPSNSFFWDNGRSFYKCYSLQVPENRNLNTFSVLIKNSIFPGGVRTNDVRFMTMLHTKNQLLTSGTLKFMYPRRERNDTYSLRYKIKGVEFVRRRNKKNQPCHEDWTNYDEEILKRHVMLSGCSPPYIGSVFNTSPCSTKDQIASSLFSLRFDDYDVEPPCQGMEKIDYFLEEHVWKEKDIWWNKTSSEGAFWFGLYIYDQKFKEIVQIKAIDVNGLVGYIGGYIGLILGYSILQIPELIVILVRKLKAYRSNGLINPENSSPKFMKTKNLEYSHYDQCCERNLIIEKELQKVYREIKLIKEQQNRRQTGW